MNVTLAQLLTKYPNRGGRCFLPKLAVMLFVFFLTAAPVLADGVRITQVVQTLTNSQATPQLRLNTLAQDPVAPGTKGSSQQNGPTNGAQGQPNDAGVESDVVSGVTISSESAKLGVDIIEEGEVDGTICDCGELLVAGGAFPKWPFLFLGAVPLIFINQCDDCDTPDRSTTPTPTPTPTPPPPPSSPTPPPSEVPEPASLLLFGTGLAAASAALRRRYGKAKTSKKINAPEEE
jgi:hypothetical protein